MLSCSSLVSYFFGYCVPVRFGFNQKGTNQSIENEILGEEFSTIWIQGNSQASFQKVLQNDVG